MAPLGIRAGFLGKVMFGLEPGWGGGCGWAEIGGKGVYGKGQQETQGLREGRRDLGQGKQSGRSMKALAGTWGCRDACGVRPSERQGLRDVTLLSQMGKLRAQEGNKARSPDSRLVLIPQWLGKVGVLVTEVMGEH